MQTSTPTMKMYLAFIGSYLLCHFLFLCLANILSMPVSSMSTPISIIVAALVPGYIFVRHTHRLMAPGEKARFALGATCIVALLKCALFAVIWFHMGDLIADLELEKLFETPDLLSIIAIFVVIVFLLFTWGAIYIALGIIGKSTLRTMPQ